MNDDPTKDPVTARIIFTGVMIACINWKGQYEVGMVRCPKHNPEITIIQHESGSSHSQLVAWPAGHDLVFRVTNPDVDGVSIHPTTKPDFSFHRVLDMEGFLLHRRRVTVDPLPLQGRRLAVTAGRLYTHALSDPEFDVLTWTGPADPGTRRGHIGKIARQVGLNILCRNESGSGVQLMDLETNQELWPMPVVSGRTYEIRIDNDCSKTGGSPAEIGSDFRYFYKQGFVRSDDGLKFDLDYHVSSTVASTPSPDACENTFLSETHTLGIKS